MSELNKYFLNDLENYWHCEVRDATSGNDLIKALNHPSHLINEQDFKAALAAAIDRRIIGVKEYERITGIDFESPDDVVADLRSLWGVMYGFDKGLE